MGWHEEAKRAEMKSKELRYLLVEAEEVDEDDKVKEGTDGAYEAGKRGRGKMRAFVSMMPTWENGEAVVYCYEIHVQPYLQGYVPLSSHHIARHVFPVADTLR